MPEPGLLADLVVGEAVLRGAVIVRVARVAEFLAGPDYVVGEVETIAHVGDPKPARGAAERRVAAVAPLRFLEEGQHLLPGPAAIAHLRPVVEVAGIATHIEHPVDRRGAADDLAARQRHGAVVRVVLRVDLEPPVHHVAVEGPRVSGGNVDEGVAVQSACLQNEHAVAAPLRKPGGQNGAGRTGADDDPVEAAGVLCVFAHRSTDSFTRRMASIWASAPRSPASIVFTVRWEALTLRQKSISACQDSGPATAPPLA